MAPTLVAGYASPRHMYLASVGWAILLAVPAELLWRRGGGRRALGRGGARDRGAGRLRRRSSAVEVALWDVRAMVSHRIVLDLEQEAQRMPAGTLVLAGAPRRSFDFAVPHALRPPFTATDLTARLRVVTHSSIHCCPAHLWEPHTRGLLQAWMDDPAHPPVVVFHWDADDRGRRPASTTRPSRSCARCRRCCARRATSPSLDTMLLAVVSKLAEGRGRATARP